MKFVHAADLHLDSPFVGMSSEAPEHVSDTLLRATFDAYANIIDLCIEEQVHALLIAGDAYDSADRSLRAQLKFGDGLKRLDEAGVRSFICHGNHDPLDGWEARLELPGGCVRFGPEVTGEPVFPEDPERARVYGISYPQREVHENLALRFRELPQSRFNIGLLHPDVGGNPGHSPHAPCSLADLANSSMDYWALGHVHTRQVLRQEHPAVVYPGNPQGCSPDETGARGVYLVEVDDDGTPHLEFRPVDLVRWESLEVDITGLETEQELLNAMDAAASSCAKDAGGRALVLRLTLTGRGPLHSSLCRPDTAGAILGNLNDHYASARPWLWCERIQLETASPVDRGQVAQRDDFPGYLARIAEELRNDPGAFDELRDALRPLYLNSNAAPYLRNFLPSDDQLRELLTAAEYECLAALVNEEEEG